MHEQVPFIRLISHKLYKLQVCYVDYEKDILQSFRFFFFERLFGKRFIIGFVSTCTDQVVL